MNIVVMAVAERTGNIIGKKQLNMIESRLTKRAMTLGLADEAAYIAYFKQHRESEIEDLVSAFTIHHSFFFREFSQFEYLKTSILPNLIEEVKNSGRKKIRIWSAASSKGQEAYSLFMFIDHYFKTNSIDLSIEIIGTDIDKMSVKFANNAVYTWNEVKEIPLTYLSQYWTRGTGEISNFAKIKEDVKKLCSFRTLNLMDYGAFSSLGKFDLIFCRNVFIYFQKQDILKISDALAERLNPEGYLFVGLSEALTKNPKGLVKLSPSIFGPEIKAVVQKIIPKPVRAPSPIRIFCVDDLMTLDIHMPELDGIGYLEKYYNASHPPVLMLTSASRENMDLAYKALGLGAKDYIEKPALNNIDIKANEIRMKIKTVVGTLSSEKIKLAIEKKSEGLAKSIDLNSTAQVIFVDDDSLKNLVDVLNDKNSYGIPTIIVNIQDIGGTDQVSKRLNALPSISSRLKDLDLRAIQNNIYYTNLDGFEKYGPSVLERKKFCYQFLTNINRTQWNRCLRRNLERILILEDTDRSIFSGYLSMLFVSPASSFAYMTKEFLSQPNKKAV
jgi:chemotaxis protein methyltransferase CheR